MKDHHNPLLAGLAPAAVVGLMVGAWAAIGVWTGVVGTTGGSVIGTAAGSGMLGAVLIDILQGRL